VTRVRLIHWNPTEARACSTRLRGLGYTVDSRPPAMPELLRELPSSPPAAVVIDLTRSPSQGRDLGILLRQRKVTRPIPLVFAGGAPEKVARVRELLPDATFTEWETIAAALRRAVAHPTAAPVVHTSAFAAYAGRPLVQRLGIKRGMHVALVGAPSEFKGTLTPLPQGVRLTAVPSHVSDLILWFVRRPSDLKRGLPKMRMSLGKAHMWIAWPKGGTAAKGDLTQQVVRAQALAAGLVDYKICSVDTTWSALLFRRRGTKPVQHRRTQA
jgi:CheY-like chemotaxis protein